MTRTARTSGLIAVLAFGALGLAACGPGGSYGSSGATVSQAAANGTAAGTVTAAALKTANTSLGTVVVNGSGRTVYMFDKDTKGTMTSACTGSCASIWPAVPASAGSPQLTGVTGTVGTITRDDGTKQVTLDGRPIYTFSGDSGAGGVSGQGYQGLWWVVAPDGSEMSASPMSPSGY